MPYIKMKRRLELDEGSPANTAGELNYMITKQLTKYIAYNGKFNYQMGNDIMGACDGAKAEIYRRVIAPYEDKKIIENGDVYD